jgi:nitroreductase
MTHQDALYQAILARCSVRRYDKAPLDEAKLAQVRGIISSVKPLISDNRFTVLAYDVSADEDLVATLGAYGRLVSPPHYLVPTMTGKEFLLEDLGYRTEQIAVRLTALGLGSCYIGSLGREAAVRARFALPEDARIGAFLVYGLPSEGLNDQAVNTMIRAAVGANRKLPPERVFFQGTFDAPTTPPLELAPLIEAACHAPSAVNAQPWRLLWHGDRLHLFVRRHNLRYGGGATAYYRLFDGGICMANVALASEALGMKSQWTMYKGTEPDVPPHPASLQPVAKLDPS